MLYNINQPDKMGLKTGLIGVLLACCALAQAKPSAVEHSTKYAIKPSFHSVVLLKDTLIPLRKNDSASLINISDFDFFLHAMRPYARHYPPSFKNRTSQYNNAKKITRLCAWLSPFANHEDASFDVLLRAAEINLMARNLDQGENYAASAGRYISRAVELQPEHPEAVYLYGSMLAEGGAFRSGLGYLERAAKLGFLEAYQSMAQAYLLTERKQEALEALATYQKLVPNDAKVKKQIKIVKQGGYYIWK